MWSVCGLLPARPLATGIPVDSSEQLLDGLRRCEDGDRGSRVADLGEIPVAAYQGANAGSLSERHEVVVVGIPTDLGHVDWVGTGSSVVGDLRQAQRRWQVGRFYGWPDESLEQEVPPKRTPARGGEDILGQVQGPTRFRDPTVEMLFGLVIGAVWEAPRSSGSDRGIPTLRRA